MNTQKAWGSGEHRALVLVELGIDNHEATRAKVDYRRGHYGEAWEVLSDAIEALEVLRDQLGVVQATPAARAAPRNAFELGRDVARGGLPLKEVSRDS